MAQFDANDDDEEEDQDQAETDDQSESPTANNAEAADPRALLYQNLQNKLSMAPNPAQLADSREQMTDEMAKNNLYAALAQSAAQAGSIGGHIASAAPVQQMAQGANQAAAQGFQGMQQQAEQGDQARDQLMRYLQQKTMSEIAGQKFQLAQKAEAEKTGETKRHNLAVENIRANPPEKPQNDTFTVPPQTDADGNILTLNKATGQLQSTGIQSQKAVMAANAPTKLDASDQKVLINIDKQMDPEQASSRSGLGKLNTTKDAADKLLQLHEQSKTQPGGLSPAQIEEMAVASGNLVSGGTGSAISIVNAMVPNTRGTVEARVKEWLTNAPQGTDQQAFVDRMAETAVRERALANEKIKLTQSKILNGVGTEDLWGRHPELRQKLQSKYYDPADKFDDSGNYVMQKFQAAPPPAAPPPAGTAMAAPGGGFTKEQIAAEIARRKAAAAGAPQAQPQPAPAGFAGPPPGGP